MQQKSSRVFPCSLGLPNCFMFGLQGVCCECVLKPRFENEPIFKLYLHTEKLVIVAQLSKHLHRAGSLWPGSTGEKQAASRRGGRAGLGWVHRWSLLEVLPFGFDAFSRWSFFLCLPGCLVSAQLALGFEGDFQSVPAW